MTPASRTTATGRWPSSSSASRCPVDWSLNATNILAQKYFRGTIGTPEREWSLKQVADRVVDTITTWGTEGGYFADDREAAAFNAELKHLIVTQKAAFNSPVWFNIGVGGVPQQASACQPYDALVSTPDGSIPIGQLVEDGRRRYEGLRFPWGHTRVVATKHNGRKHVLRLHTHAGLTLDVTPDHLVWRCSGVGTGSFRPGRRPTGRRPARMAPHLCSYGAGEIAVREIA